MHKSVYTLGLLLTGVALFSSWVVQPDWGFFGHRRINRLAVFTLPPEMMPIYKKHLEYITDHAVDPDKRRYATPYEAIRHYIDIDHWGEYPFREVPRYRTDAILKYADVYGVWETTGDTVRIFGLDLQSRDDRGFSVTSDGVARAFGKPTLTFPYWKYRTFFGNKVLPLYYETEWRLDGSMLDSLYLLEPVSDYPDYLIVEDQFSEYGILPYHLVYMQGRLRQAFEAGDPEQVLRISADFGHYIADAHVPLHTTENYNGQLTDQKGIHAFWESRLPEIYADATYDYFVGKAEYIDDPTAFYWDVILESHSYLDSVLLIEKDLSRRFPKDQQYCYEERNERTVRQPCLPYAAAYHARLDGMVEARMRASILAVGSAWYTAWVDAGQPDLRRLGIIEEMPEQVAADSLPLLPTPPDGRDHDH